MSAHCIVGLIIQPEQILVGIAVASVMVNLYMNIASAGSHEEGL